MKRTPAAPAKANAAASCVRAHAEKTQNPNASPPNAKATQGTVGKSQACGAPRLCTPLMYDSRYQGSQRGWCVVQSGGVASATSAAAAVTSMTYRDAGTTTAGSAAACAFGIPPATSPPPTPPH